MNRLRFVAGLVYAISVLPSPAADRIEQIEIEARFEGFDKKKYAEAAELQGTPLGTSSRNVLSAPRVTTRAGNRSVIEVIREQEIPKSPTGETKVTTGVMVDVLPTVKGSEITLAGKCTLRRALPQVAAQPLGAKSFLAHEVHFGGTFESGKAFTIAVGDGLKDKSRIVLTATVVNAIGEVVR